MNSLLLAAEPLEFGPFVFGLFVLHIVMAVALGARMWYNGRHDSRQVEARFVDYED